jgi:hypothetical protein
MSVTGIQQPFYAELEEELLDLAEVTAQAKQNFPQHVQMCRGDVSVTMHQLREPRIQTIRKAGRYADLMQEGHSLHRQYLDPPPGTQAWQGDCDCNDQDQDVTTRVANTAGCGLSEREAYALETWAAIEDATNQEDDEEGVDDSTLPDPFDIHLSMQTQIDPRRDRTACGRQWSLEEQSMMCLPAPHYNASSNGYSDSINHLFAPLSTA